MSKLSGSTIGNAVLVLLFAGIAIAILNDIATSPRVPATWRLIAKDVEGLIYQDIATGQIFKLAL